MVPLFVLMSLFGCGDKVSPKDVEEDGRDTPIVSDDTGPTSTPNDTGDSDEPVAFEVTGTVVDRTGTPVPEALVLVGGREDTMVTTDDDGRFSLWYIEQSNEEPAIVAGKIGYRSVGVDFFDEGDELTIEIRPVSPPDNIDYVYQGPGDGIDTMKEDCSHCHVHFVRDFLDSKHAEATRNPLLQDLYAGVSAHGDRLSCEDAGGVWGLGFEPGTEGDIIDKCYLGGGVLPDLNASCGGIGQPHCDDPDLDLDSQPESFGACADCHAPGIDGIAGGRNLHDAHGLSFEIGVHCDTCHKVRDVDLSQPPGVGQRLIMGRPNEPGQNTFVWDPVYFGPLVDVPNPFMRGSLQPKFDSAEFCAGCHEQNQEALIPGESLDPDLWPDGLPTHSTYSEWEAGPYNQDATQCQFCHMPADVEATNSVHLWEPGGSSILLGWPRPPEDNRKHTFRGPLDGNPRLIDGAVYTSIALQQTDDTLEATVSIANIGCGHAIPTGEPMRALVLVVEASGDCGDLKPIDGMTIGDVGGALAETIIDMPMSDVTEWTWPEAAEIASAGQVLRIVRPSGDFDDYAGVGLFSDETLSPEDKGMEIDIPVGTIHIVDISGDVLMLETPISLEEGDRVFLGDALPESLDDEAPSHHLAGASGYTFSRVLTDSAGNRQVPHYKAIDMVSDNRIGPGENALTSHTFAWPSSCSTADVRATVMYRPHPLNLAVERNWEVTDYVISKATASLTP